MAPVEALPKQLSPKWFRKQELTESRNPPISFVPSDRDYTGKVGARPEKAKIDATKEVKKEYVVLKDANFEDVLRLIDRHKTLCVSRKFTERLKDNQQLLTKKVNEYNKLKVKKGDHRLALEELSSAAAELKVDRSDLQNGPFDLLGELVEESLKTKWQDIVTEQTDGPYVDLNGQSQTGPRKKSATVLEDCYTHFCDFLVRPILLSVWTTF